MFEFKKILPDGKVLIQVDDNFYKLEPSVVHKRHQELSKKLMRNGGLDYFETAWIWAYELALKAMRGNLFAGNGGGHV